MVPDKKYGFPLFFAVLMAVPIYFAIQLGKDATAENWEMLESGLTNYLIALWSTWIFTISMAIYYKWTGRGNMLFSLNYGFVVVACGLYAYFTQYLGAIISGEEQGYFNAAKYCPAFGTNYSDYRICSNKCMVV